MFFHFFCGQTSSANIPKDTILLQQIVCIVEVAKLENVAKGNKKGEKNERKTGDVLSYFVTNVILYGFIFQIRQSKFKL